MGLDLHLSEYSDSADCAILAYRESVVQRDSYRKAFDALDGNDDPNVVAHIKQALETAAKNSADLRAALARYGFRYANPERQEARIAAWPIRGEWAVQVACSTSPNVARPEAEMRGWSGSAPTLLAAYQAARACLYAAAEFLPDNLGTWGRLDGNESTFDARLMCVVAAEVGQPKPPGRWNFWNAGLADLETRIDALRPTTEMDDA